MPLLSNRIVFLLACVGVAITLYLGFAHTSGASVPCGAQPEGVLSGCDRVAQDAWSRIFGAPIAFYGAAMYIVIAGLAALREAVGIHKTPNIGGAMWFGLGVGAVGAGMLLGRTHFVIGASCIWCLSSHILTFAAFLTQTVGLSSQRSGGDTSEAPGRLRIPWVAFPVVLLFAAVAGGGSGAKLLVDQKKELAGGAFENTEQVPITRDYNPVYGDEGAPITIVEFSDLHCPICSHWHSYMKRQMADELKGKVRLVFRHFPIKELHPHATTAALFGVYAHEHGRFWEFADANFENQDGITGERLNELLTEVGLDEADALGLHADERRRKSLLSKVWQDMDDALKLGVRQTPWWFIIYPNGDVEYAIGGGIDERINSAKFKRALAEVRK